tara:strand:+ start:126 stop:404 length:279 start_codon:yes stop_codon:yes gene_type:complete
MMLTRSPTFTDYLQLSGFKVVTNLIGLDFTTEPTNRESAIIGLINNHSHRILLGGNVGFRASDKITDFHLAPQFDVSEKDGFYQQSFRRECE